jgi:sulfonate transport system permease protein
VSISGRALAFAGPVAFLALWWAVSASHVVRAVLLPSPFATLAYLGTQLFAGSLGADALITLSRTLIAFAIGAALGVPIGVAFGSSERLYRSIEFLIDFFRSTPASALIPLFILFFGITDVNKIAIAGFSVFLIVTFNSAYGVMNARKSRILAAKVMGASRFAIFRDVLIFESLPQTFVGLRNGISTAPHHRGRTGAARDRHVRLDHRGRAAGLLPQRRVHAGRQALHPLERQVASSRP